MSKRYLFFLFSLSIVLSGYAQTINWVKTFGNSYSDMTFSSAIDGSGNVYLGGYFYGTVDFNPDPAVSENKTSFGSKDMFLAKFDQSGNFLWVKQFGGSQNEEIRSLSIDQDDNLIVTGFFEGTCDFDPGTGINNHTAEAINNAFILKLNPSGTILWERFFPPYLNNKSASSMPVSSTVDDLGNIYITGIYNGFVNFLGKPYSGSNDIFITKINASGVRIWSRRLQAQNECMVTSMVVHNQWKDVYLSGYFKNSINVYTNDPAQGISQHQNADGGMDYFILKLDHSGDFEWVNSHKGSTLNSDEEIAYNLTLGYGSIYSSGYLNGGIDLTPDNPVVYEITTGGQKEAIVNQWHYSGGDGAIYKVQNSASGSNSSIALAITSDASGNLYYTGFFEGTVDFDPSPTAISNLTSNGGKDIFICKMDRWGNLIWAQSIGGSGNDVGNSITFSNSHLYLSGSYENTVDFDFGASTNNHTASGLNDSFVIKLTP